MEKLEGSYWLEAFFLYFWGDGILFKTYFNGPLGKWLFAGAPLENNKLFARMLLANNNLFAVHLMFSPK